MKQNKFQWKSQDGANPRLAQPFPEDESDNNIALQPQRIRVFRVHYKATRSEEGGQEITQ